MNEKIINQLKDLARQDCVYDSDSEDEFLCIDDYAGGNIDDAFFLGETAGKVTLARSLLKAMRIDWQQTDEGERD